MRFVRKREYLERSGYCNTEFHEAQKTGRISRPARDERRKLQKALRRKDKR